MFWTTFLVFCERYVAHLLRAAVVVVPAGPDVAAFSALLAHTTLNLTLHSVAEVMPGYWQQVFWTFQMCTCWLLILLGYSNVSAAHPVSGI